MRKSMFTDNQIMNAVKRVVEGFEAPDICREGWAPAPLTTFCKWRAKYGGMDVSMMRCMNEFQHENRHLKKMCLE